MEAQPSQWWKREGGIVLPFAAALWYFLQNTSGIKWGDGLEFTAVSTHLGVAHPPGYPLFTLLGWFALKLPVEPYQAILILCKLAAAACVIGLYFFLRSFLKPQEEKDISVSWLAGILSAAFAFSSALWPTTHVVEVYGLSAALIIWSLYLLLSEDARWPRLIGGAVLAGLAVANHLTSLALLPVFLLLAYQRKRVLLLLPILILIPFFLYLSLLWRVPDTNGYGIFWGGLNDNSQWWTHVRGGEYGQYQFMRPAPGQSFTLASYLTFVLSRIGALARNIGGLFFGQGPAAVFGGLLCFAVAVLGGIKLFARRELRPVALALLMVIVLQVLFLFLYNIPDYEDYLLVPLLLTVPFLAYGLVEGVRWLLRTLQLPLDRLPRQTLTASCLLLTAAILTNFRDASPATAPLAEAYRERLLEALPEGAGLITTHDADIYTMWYVQFTKKERPDIAVYGSNFNRFSWFRETMPPGDSRRQAVGFHPGPPPRSLQEHIGRVSDDAIDPMLQSGPVFMANINELELQVLGQRYQLLPAAELLTQRDLAVIEASGEVNVPPWWLWEIRLKESE